MARVLQPWAEARPLADNGCLLQAGGEESDADLRLLLLLSRKRTTAWYVPTKERRGFSQPPRLPCGEGGTTIHCRSCTGNGEEVSPCWCQVVGLCIAGREV